MLRVARFSLFSILLFALTQVLGAGNYFTPASSYSTPKSKGLAQQYNSLMDGAIRELTSVYDKDELRIVTVDESAVGGAGFWKNPSKIDEDYRYASLLVMAKTPPYLFGDDRNGHVASVLDRYGKSMMSALTKQMEAMGNQVDGIAVCIVWGGSVGGDPAKAGSEAMALFLARSDVIQYKNYKLTIEALVNRNDLFLFNGSSQIDNMLQFILEP